MEKPVQKNKEYIVDIIDNGYNGEGIAKIDDFTIFVNGAIKGEKCRVLILKVNKAFAFGKVLEVIKQSFNRIEPDCATYKRCGGCSLRHIKYDETLNIKRNIVQNLLNKSLKKQIEVKEVIGMAVPFYYRNKLQYPVGKNKKGQSVMGVFANRTHEIIPIRSCLIQNQEAEKVAIEIFNFIKENNIEPYDENTGTGIIRHIIVKIGVKTNELMCIIVVNKEKIEKEIDLIKTITKKFPQVKTIIKNINKKNTNVILGDKNIILYGKGYIYDKLGTYTFKITPMSFYQTNPLQTEILYNKAIEFANIKESDILCDLYCGIGTIGIFASKMVKKVYGIEIVKEAIEAANENAELNRVNNIEFIAGDVEEAFKKLIEKKQIQPNIVIVDPPRKGLDDITINKLNEISVNRIVYISCNPATMARDLKILEEKYEVKEVQPVDMFPYTSHVECVAVLEVKKTIEK